MAAVKLARTDLLTLPNSSTKIPRLGFGVYQSHGNQCVASCLAALKAGYRFGLVESRPHRWVTDKSIGILIQHSSMAMRKKSVRLSNNLG
jgi:hypothetical protein